jgi:hypothetical protein
MGRPVAGRSEFERLGGPMLDHLPRPDRGSEPGMGTSLT